MTSRRLKKMGKNRLAVASLVVVVYASLPVLAGVGVFLTANAVLFLLLTTFQTGFSGRGSRVELRLREMNVLTRFQWALVNAVFFALSTYTLVNANARLLDLL